MEKNSIILLYINSMDPIITQLLEQAQVSESLESYTYIPTSELKNIPLGSYIKFIDRNENIKSGGFLIKISIKPDRTKSYIILKSNLMYKLYVYYYWIFFKPIAHESKITKTIRNSKIDILKNELPNSNSKTELENNSTPTPTTMNIIIKPMSESKTKTKTKTNSKTKSNTKSSIFKELLESLDKQTNK